VERSLLWKSFCFTRIPISKYLSLSDIYAAIARGLWRFVEYAQNCEATESEHKILAPLAFIVVLARNYFCHLDIIKEMLRLINT
jgi:hypothetical protein